VDADGNALAVWSLSTGIGKSNIWINRYMAGNGWGTAELIGTNITENARFPQIALDAKGNALAVWQQFNITDNVWANRYVAGSGWGNAELIETGNSYARSPQIALSAGGNGLAVWFQLDGTRASIFANRFD